MIDAVLDAYGKFGVGRQRLNVSRNAARPEANPEGICDPVLEINSTRTCLDSWRAVPLMQRMGGDSNINLASIIAAVGDGRIFRACWADSIPLYRPRTRPLRFTSNLALAYASENIRVTCICPGCVESNRTVELTSDPEAYATLTKCARSAGLENARKSPARFHFWLRMYLSSPPAHR